MTRKLLTIAFCFLFLGACHRESKQTINLTTDQIKELYSLAGTTALGKKDAPITIVEVFSYDCRYCRQDYPLLEQFAKQHNNVRIIFKPFMAFGEQTKTLPQYAVLAAGKQNQFLAMHRALITTNRPLTAHLIDKIAKELKLNMAVFHHDMNSSEVMAQIKTNTDLMNDLAIDGIPTLIMTQTRLIDHPELANQIPVYIQVGFMSNDILTSLLNQVKKDMQ